MKKILAAFMIVILTATLFTGCQNRRGAGKEAVTLRFATFQVGVNPSAPWMAEVIKAFNEKYAGKIQLQVEEIPGDQAYVDRMKAYISDGDVPDLMFAGGYNLLDDVLEAGLITDLTPYFEADEAFSRRFFAEDLAYTTRNGKIYGMPVERQPITYFYNKELFAKAGITTPARTWPQFMTQLEALKAAGITPLSMDTADSAWLSTLWLNSMMGTLSPESRVWMNQTKPRDYSLPEFIQATDAVQKMLVSYTTPDALGGSFERGANHFLSEKTAIIANGPWMISDFTAKGSEAFAAKVGTALYPGDGIFSGSMPGYLVGSKDKVHADAAVEFLKFISSEEMQLKALEMHSAIPANRYVEINDAIIARNPLLGEIVRLQAQAKNVYGNYQSLWYSNVLEELDKQYPLLGAGAIAPEEFAKRLSEAARRN